VERPRPDQPLPRWLNVVTGIPIALGIMFIAAIGFFGSFEGMSKAVRPYFHDLAWIVPIGVDTAILVLSAVDLRAMRARVGVPWLRYVLYFLNATTVYFNSTAADDFKGKAYHAILPLLYIFCIEVIRAALSKWVNKQDDDHIERIPRSMWLTPFSTAGMWYRRHRWRVKSIDELVARERARTLLIYRLKARAGVKPWFRRKWKQEASADERWAVDTYALDSEDPTVRRTATAVTRSALAAQPQQPAITAHTPASGVNGVHASDRRAVSAPAVTRPQNGARVYAPDAADAPPGRPDDVQPEKWARTWTNPEACTAWDSYRHLRAQADGAHPQVKDVHEHSGVQRDRSMVSRWMPFFHARFDAEGAHGTVHTPPVGPAESAITRVNGHDPAAHTN
jgi:hypothetical protein